jgi:homoserine dehydrogenase
MKMKKMRLALIGFGNVGREFCRILLSKQKEWEKAVGWAFPVTAIVTSSKGALFNSEGINLQRALLDIETSSCFGNSNLELSNISSMDATRLNCVDLVIEITTLNIKNGQPAADHVAAALQAGKHVITANKGPVAFYYRKLQDLADKQNRFFLFEGTVMDCAPVFNLVRETLPGCNITSFRGILNSTTNYILCEMEKGLSFKEALLTAQKMGWVEADPSMDIEGWDAAAKTSALLNVFCNAGITPQEIERTGISLISKQMIEEARIEGKVMKLVCEGGTDKKGKLYGRVVPTAINMTDSLAKTKGTTSTLQLLTDLAGKITITIEDPKIGETAYALVSDLLTICKNS